MKYHLHNGKKIIIRELKVEDAKGIIELISKADTETLFLARNPGEFNTTVEKEKNIIEHVINSKNMIWFIAEYNGCIIGQASVSLVRNYERYRHRAEVGFVILKDYCNMGIGSKLMQECINWCKNNDITQIELNVVTNNTRAIKMYQKFGFEILGKIPNALKYDDNRYADEYMMIYSLPLRKNNFKEKNLIIRIAKKEDLEQVNKLRKQVNDIHCEGRPDIFRTGWRKELQEHIYEIFENDKNDIIVVIIDNKIVGYACVAYVNNPIKPHYLERNFYYIDEFGVDEKYRRQGIATKLFNYMKNDAKKRGYAKIELDVWNFNENAINFYKKLGFNTYRSFMELNNLD